MDITLHSCFHISWILIIVLTSGIQCETVNQDAELTKNSGSRLLRKTRIRHPSKKSLEAAKRLEDDTKYTSDEARLIDDLLARYKSFKTLARPVLNSNSTLNVSFGISLQQILGFDEKDQVLQTRMWKEYQWVDEYATWYPEDYGGTDVVVLPNHYFWFPDIILFNNVDSSKSEDHSEMMLVSSKGEMTWIPPVIYKSSCQVDMTDYPFDIQTCSLRFGSWSYDTKRLDLHFLDQIEGMKMDGYVPNSEWEIIENTAQRNIIIYDCCPNAYGDLTFSLTLKRKVSFQLRLMLLPTLLLSTISLFMFWIPAHRPDRTALGMSLFSSFFLLLLLIFNISPPTANVKIGHFFCIVILLVTIGIMLSVFVINISQSTREMPHLLDKIIDSFIGRILCPCGGGNKARKKHQDEPEDILSTTVCHGNPNKINCNNQSNVSLVPAKSSPTHSIAEGNMQKWRTFGIIIDRFFFLIYFSTLVSAFIFVFPKPHMIVHIL